MTLNLESSRLKKLEIGLKCILQQQGNTLELSPNINISYLMEQKRRWRNEWLEITDKKWQIFTNPNWAPLDHNFEYFCDITDIKMLLFRIIYNHIKDQFEQDFIYESTTELILKESRTKTQIEP